MGHDEVRRSDCPVPSWARLTSHRLQMKKAIKEGDLETVRRELTSGGVDLEANFTVSHWVSDR